MTTTRRIVLSALVLATAVALAGCAPATGKHLPGSLPTVTSHSATAPGKPKLPPRPKLLTWNGDCTVFFTDAQSQTITGLPTTLQPDSGFLEAADQVTVLGGGHYCSYADSDGDSENVSIFVFPATLPGAVASAPKCDIANTGPVQFEDTCTAAIVTHGYWLDMSFSPSTTFSYAQVFAAVNTIFATFTTKTALYAPPVAPASIAGTWTKTETCDALAAHSGAAAAIGYPTMGDAIDPIYNLDGPAFLAAQTSVGAVACQFGSMTGLAPSGKLTGFQVYLVPGGGKINPPTATPNNSTPVTIPGASAAWDIEYNGNNVVQVFAVAGSNYLEFTPDGNQVLSLAQIAPAISKIITTMNAGG